MTVYGLFTLAIDTLKTRVTSARVPITIDVTRSVHARVRCAGVHTS